LFAAATALEAKSSLRTAVPKLLDFLSVAALQTPTTASYILRLPATLSFLRVSTAHLTSAPHSEVAVQPVQLIPLLLGLLRASGISASVTSELESMLCVVAGITVTRITTAIEAQQAAAEADDDEEREAQDPAGVSRLRKAMTVPGLARCLQLITLPQSGGVAALQSIAAIQPVSATSASIRLIATEAGKLCAGDMKRLAKSTLSFLDGHGASKVD
jgi:hypothetical protein